MVLFTKGVAMDVTTGVYIYHYMYYLAPLKGNDTGVLIHARVSALTSWMHKWLVIYIVQVLYEEDYFYIFLGEEIDVSTSGAEEDMLEFRICKVLHTSVG